MKHALIDDQLTLASADAPAMAICPHCGGFVELRSRTGSYFWRHQQLPLGGCQPQQAPAGAAESHGDTTAAGRWTRRVKSFVIELHPDEDADGYHLKLRNLSAKETGGPCEIMIPLDDVRLLVQALLDAVADWVNVTLDDAGSATSG